MSCKPYRTRGFSKGDGVFARHPAAPYFLKPFTVKAFTPQGFKSFAGAVFKGTKNGSNIKLGRQPIVLHN